MTSLRAPTSTHPRWESSNARAPRRGQRCRGRGEPAAVAAAPLGAPRAEPGPGPAGRRQQARPGPGCSGGCRAAVPATAGREQPSSGGDRGPEAEPAGGHDKGGSAALGKPRHGRAREGGEGGVGDEHTGFSLQQERLSLQ